MRENALAIAALAFGIASCTVSLDQEELDFDFSEARARCVAPLPEGVLRNGAFSLALPEGSYFVFGETWTGGDELFRVAGSSGAVVPAGSDPCDGLDDVRDASGPIELIACTAEEEEFDRAAMDGRTTILYPLAGFARGGEGILFYKKARRASLFDVVPVGVGVALIRYGEVAERVTPNRYVDEPTLFFLAPEDNWGSSAFVAPDGFAYLYGCYRRGEWDDVCRVARVEPDRAEDPDAYRFFDGDDWSPSPASAAVIADELQGMSVAYTLYRDRYVSFQTGYLENSVLGSLAPAPSGVFGRRHELYVGRAPSAFWIRDLSVHAGYASADGREFLTSYYSDPPGSAPGMRFVDVTLK